MDYVRLYDLVVTLSKIDIVSDVFEEIELAHCLESYWVHGCRFLVFRDNEGR